MSDATSTDTTGIAHRLLEIVQTLNQELQPRRRGARVTLDSSLDRELGFDSLSRVELLLRVERGLDVRLSEQVFSVAETPRDLLNAVLTALASGAPTEAADVGPITMGLAAGLPLEAGTLIEVLDWHVLKQPDRPHALLYEVDTATPATMTYKDLRAGALRLADGLIRQGIEPGQAVAIMLPTGRDYLESFFAVLYAGAVPVPIYPPARASQLEDHLRRHAKILSNAQTQLLITVPEALAVARLLRAQVTSLTTCTTPDLLAVHDMGATPVPVRADDVALLQYTSGSTGQPKGVVLTHAQLLANIRAMGDAVAATPDDVFVSWLPLYHDMGLIGAWLGSLYFSVLVVLMSPVSFLTRPWRWLWAIHNHGGTLSSAPNFAYELCLSKIPDSELEGLDLGTWRIAFNGAEPVSPQTLRRVEERFEQYGFDPHAIAPVYGLAEAAVGLAFPPLGRGAIVDRIQRDAFETAGRATPAESDDERALEFVACGQPLPGYEIRIADPFGKELPERREGRLEFRGPSATRGYFRNREATSSLFDGEWLDSGDLAYVAGGDVYLTSRIKDVIIRAGRNIYPYELEEAVGDLPEVRKGCVAVFGSADPASNIERLIVVAETRETDVPMLQSLRSRIETLASDLLGVSPDDVLFAPPRTILKTSSGKIRRAACRELYEQHRIGKRPRADWMQVVRLWLAGLSPRWQRLLRVGYDWAYAGYAYLILGLVFPIALIPVVLIPRPSSRWRWLGRCARLLLRLARVPIVVEGQQHLSETDRCVLVSNHASYLDGLMLTAVLPTPVTFIAKAELRAKWFPNWFLNRIQARFVERIDSQQGVADAQALTASVGQQAPLLFFAEGTFTRSPGLLPFHMGAFVTAAANGLSVVPITIRGTRSLMREDIFFPRRGTVAVIISAPIEPSGTDWDAAITLRNQVRAQVLRHLGEPDLATEHVSLT